MDLHFAKIISNILVCFIKSSERRKIVRRKIRENLTFRMLSLYDIVRNKIFNNSIKILDSNGKEHLFFYPQGIKIKFRGKNSKIIIHTPSLFDGCSFDVGSDSIIEISNTEHIIRNLSIQTQDFVKVSIGKDFSCEGCGIGADRDVFIGNDCMFSFGINLLTSDCHTIYDIQNHNPINIPERGIKIGNHVWFGKNTTILKEVSLCNNIIVGANSTVIKDNTIENTIIAGSPAKVIKKNIGWKRENNIYN